MGGGAKDGGDVGVIGFVVRVGGLAVLLGGEGMDEACLEAGLAEGLLDGPMIFAGAFDGDDEVAEVVLLASLTDAVAGGLEVAARVVHGVRFEEGVAVEVGEEVVGARLGAIDGDNAEVFGSDSLDAWDELAVGFKQNKGFAGPGVPWLS